jgi:hypothetical protein
MRVLNGRILVAIKTTTTDSLVAEDNSRRGKVTVSAANEIRVNEEILFGEKFEEVSELEVRGSTKYYLMEKENVRIIYDGDDPTVRTNVLPFLQEKRSA